MLSVSGHKVFAPKGIGALVARRRGYRRVPLQPLMFGGGQERGLRPGTLPVALIAGLGLAAELALKENDARARHALALKHQALNALSELGIQANGDEEHTVPHTLNFSVPGVDAEAAIVALKEVVAISNGSACTSQKYEPSHVLVAADLPKKADRRCAPLLMEPLNRGSALGCCCTASRTTGDMNERIDAQDV